jgi:hypothetical protein
MTFEEINDLDLDKSIKSLVMKIYYKEYSKNIEDSSEFRYKVLKEIRKIIK